MNPLEGDRVRNVRSGEETKAGGAQSMNSAGKVNSFDYKDLPADVQKQVDVIQAESLAENERFALKATIAGVAGIINPQAMVKQGLQQGVNSFAKSLSAGPVLDPVKKGDSDVGNTHIIRSAMGGPAFAATARAAGQSPKRGLVSRFLIWFFAVKVPETTGVPPPSSGSVSRDPSSAPESVSTLMPSAPMPVKEGGIDPAQAPKPGAAWMSIDPNPLVETIATPNQTTSTIASKAPVGPPLFPAPSSSSPLKNPLVVGKPGVAANPYQSPPILSPKPLPTVESDAPVKMAATTAARAVLPVDGYVTASAPTGLGLPSKLDGPVSPPPRPGSITPVAPRPPSSVSPTIFKRAGMVMAKTTSTPSIPRPMAVTGPNRLPGA